MGSSAANSREWALGREGGREGGKVITQYQKEKEGYRKRYV